MNLSSPLQQVYRALRQSQTVVTRIGEASPYLPDHLVAPRAQMEAACRQRCQNAYLGNDTLLCRVLGKYLVFADSQDVGIVPHLCLDGFWESWITQAMVTAVRPGWCCVDVGANHGYYSLLLADAVGPSGRLLACEPNPPIADLLEKTLGVNGFLGRGAVIREPVADTDDAYLNLVVPDGRSMNAFLEPDRDNTDAFKVRTVTLDTLCKHLDRVDLIKIDVEGAEEKVWQGMRKTIARNPDLVVVLEFNPGRYADPRAFVAEIEAPGFALGFVDYDGVVKPVTVERLLGERGNEDWMLWLRRGGV